MAAVNPKSTREVRRMMAQNSRAHKSGKYLMWIKSEQGQKHIKQAMEKLHDKAGSSRKSGGNRLGKSGKNDPANRQ